MMLLHLIDWGQLDLIALLAVLLVDHWEGFGVGLVPSLDHYLCVSLGRVGGAFT